MKKAVGQRLRDLAFINAFISVVDDKKVIIENVSNIIECNEITANIEASGFNVRIWGSGLSLSTYDNRLIEISGVITSIELEKHLNFKEK